MVRSRKLEKSLEFRSASATLWIAKEISDAFSIPSPNTVTHLVRCYPWHQNPSPPLSPGFAGERGQEIGNICGRCGHAAMRVQ